MWKKIALVSLAFWILTLGTAGYFFIKGTAEEGDDGRLAVKLHRAERNLVLGEMRALLSGVQTILEASLNNDMKVVETTSISLGMKAAVDVNPTLMAKLPLDFKSTGMGVHKRFDDLALKVHAGANKDEVIREVSDIMLTCVGCHQAYRLDEVD
jgi:methyl coenzyme M reductase subunit C-like uncharacterized protein (methanogenesis marker protein 7)